MRAERDLEQLIRNDSAATIGNDSHEQITRNRYRAIGGTEEHHTSGKRSTVLGADDCTSVAGSGYTDTGVPHVIYAGDQVHIKSGANVMLDTGATLTLKGGGQPIVQRSHRSGGGEPCHQGAMGRADIQGAGQDC